MRQKQPKTGRLGRRGWTKGNQKPKYSSGLPWQHRLSYYRTEFRGTWEMSVYRLG